MSDLQLTLHKWLGEFLDDMKRRDYSHRSIRAYRYDLALFVEWVGDQSELTTPGDLTAEVQTQGQNELTRLLINSPLLFDLDSMPPP